MERCLLGIQAAEKTDRRKNPKWHYRRLLPEKWNRQFMWFTNNIEPFISNHQLGWGNINTGNREDHQYKESHLAASGEPWCDPTTDTLVRWAVKGWEPELNWQHGECLPKTTNSKATLRVSHWNFRKILLLPWHHTCFGHKERSGFKCIKIHISNTRLYCIFVAVVLNKWQQARTGAWSYSTANLGQNWHNLEKQS